MNLRFSLPNPFSPAGAMPRSLNGIPNPMPLTTFVIVASPQGIGLSLAYSPGKTILFCLLVGFNDSRIFMVCTGNGKTRIFSSCFSGLRSLYRLQDQKPSIQHVSCRLVSFRHKATSIARPLLPDNRHRPVAGIIRKNTLFFRVCVPSNIDANPTWIPVKP